VQEDGTEAKYSSESYSVAYIFANLCPSIGKVL